MQIGNEILICPYCGQLTKVVWVHGHGQCMVCKTNFEECCRGESIENNNDLSNDISPDKSLNENSNKQPDNEKK